MLRAEVGGAGDAKSQSRSLPKFNKTTIPVFYRGKFSKRAIFVVLLICKDGYREGMGFIRGLRIPVSGLDVLAELRCIFPFRGAL